jgi:hypothetical protein
MNASGAVVVKWPAVDGWADGRLTRPCAPAYAAHCAGLALEEHADYQILPAS